MYNIGKCSKDSLKHNIVERFSLSVTDAMVALSLKMLSGFIQHYSIFDCLRICLQSNTWIFSISFAIILCFHWAFQWLQNSVLQKVENISNIITVFCDIFQKSCVRKDDLHILRSSCYRHIRPIWTLLSACPAHPLSQPIMASRKVPVFLAFWYIYKKISSRSNASAVK
jgi:hypothetical protein